MNDASSIPPLSHAALLVLAVAATGCQAGQSADLGDARLEASAADQTRPADQLAFDNSGSADDGRGEDSGAEQGLVFVETFDSWAWVEQDGCPYGGCCFGSPCFAVMGPPNGQPMMVRRVDGNNACTWDHEVNHWTGGAGAFHGHAGSLDWVAAHVPSHGKGTPRSHTLEMLTSRQKQSRATGTLQVDLFVHGPNIPAASGEHYLVAHNMQLSPNASCPADSGEANSATACVKPGPGCAWGWRFYAVIAGSFGSDTLGHGQLGFVVEKATATGAELLPETFLPLSVDGDQKAFPGRRWYRVRVERTATTYGYVVSTRTRGDAAWQPLGQRTVAVDRLQDDRGDFLPPGYIAVTDAFFDDARGADVVHVDWDNIDVNW